MALSHELQRLHKQESSYRGDPELVGTYIKDLEFHGVIGATTSGKTTLIDRVVDIMPDSNAVPSAMDRRRKEGDPDDYQTATEGMTTETLLKAIRTHRLVNYAIFPTGVIYATYPEYYSATHNFLPTMSSATPQLERAGFKKCNFAYVYMPAQQWKELVEHKDFDGKRKQRMSEAIESFDYGINNPEALRFVRNQYGRAGLERAARELMLVATGNSPGEDAEKAIEEIKKLHAIAHDLAA